MIIKFGSAASRISEAKLASRTAISAAERKIESPELTQPASMGQGSYQKDVLVGQDRLQRADRAGAVAGWGRRGG